jgi:putative PIN family toxin of toxin-antitoxin system
MKRQRIIIDTNVLIAALRSSRGASHRLLLRIEDGLYESAVSVPLVLEYEATAKRLLGKTRLTERDIDAIIDFICLQSVESRVSYLWRPLLKDPKDDMVLEAAVAAGCTYIVTFNVRDFAGAELFGIKIVTPREFLVEIGELS